MKRTNGHSNASSSGSNMLQDLHTRLFEAPILFRDRVCEECAWSIPTFYRKMKAIDRYNGRKKLIPCLSNAEMEKIIDVLDQEFKKLWEYCERYRVKK